MEREGASSSSSRPNRSNQQESGGEHPAFGGSQKIFDAGDLHFFDLTAEDADEASLRKSYFRKSLCNHPDKGGSTAAFQVLGFLYEKLKQGFKTLRSLQHVEPDVTVASVTTSAKNNDHNPRVASETSPAWNVRDILQPVLPLIKDAVARIVPYLEVMPDSLHAALRELAVRDEYTCHLRGVEQPAEHSRRYHGTSWQGLKQILKRGLLPTYGAGRSYQWQHHKKNGPLVYTSPDKSCASYYPMALVDNQHNQCGEVVARDTKYLRVILTCKVDITTRQVKIRRGRNKQDAFPADCISVAAVTFIAFRTAPLEQLKHYGLNESGLHYDSDASDSSDSGVEQPAVDDRETQLERLVQCQLMRMRRHRTTTHSESQYESIEVAHVTEHVRDHRSESTVAEAVLKLLEVRASELKYRGVWMDKYRSPPGQVMTDDQLKNAWSITLRAMFEDVMDDHEATDEGLSRRKRRKLNHGRFNSWLFLRFGCKSEIRNILRHGCSDDIIQRLQDIAES